METPAATRTEWECDDNAGADAVAADRAGGVFTGFEGEPVNGTVSSVHRRQVPPAAYPRRAAEVRAGRSKEVAKRAQLGTGRSTT